MPIAARGKGRYDVSGMDNTLNLRWSAIYGRPTDDTLVLNKNNIGGWGFINLGSGTDTVTLAASGDYTLQLIGVDTIKTTAVDPTTLRIRSDVTTSTDGSFSEITAMYGVQNLIFTSVLRDSTISLGELTDKVTFGTVNWVYSKVGTTVYAYDLTSGKSVGLNSDVEFMNVSGTDIATSDIVANRLVLPDPGPVNVTSLTLNVAVTEVVFNAGGNDLTASLAQLSQFTTFTGGAGTDQITMASAGTFDTTGKTLTGIESINGSSGDDTIIVTTSGITTNGNDGADSITGSTGADTITGGSGADSITGGSGADSMTGGTGIDTFVFTATTDTAITNNVALMDTIVGFAVGAGGDQLQVTLLSIDNGSLVATADISDPDSYFVEWTVGAGATTNYIYLKDTGTTVGIELTDTGGLITASTAPSLAITLNSVLSAGISLQGGGPYRAFFTDDDNPIRNDTSTYFTQSANISGGTAYTYAIADITPGSGGVREGYLTIEATNTGVQATLDAVVYVGEDTVGETIVVAYGNLPGTANTADYAIVYGNGGDDTITGGTGNDYMFGGTGADTITGGAGADVLTGGTGADTFVFAAGDSTGTGGAASDDITDLGVGDIIDLSAINTGTINFITAATATALDGTGITFTAGFDVFFGTVGGQDYLFYETTAQGTAPADAGTLEVVGIDIVGTLTSWTEAGGVITTVA